MAARRAAVDRGSDRRRATRKSVEGVQSEKERGRKRTSEFRTGTGTGTKLVVGSYPNGGPTPVHSWGGNCGAGGNMVPPASGPRCGLLCAPPAPWGLFWTLA